MMVKKILISFVVLCFVYESIASSTGGLNLNGCGCNDEGVDICTGVQCRKGSRITAPRPHPIQPPRPSQPLIKTICKEQSIDQPKPFNPIGDSCNCGRLIVKPAPLPNVRALCSNQQNQLFRLPKFEQPRSSCTCNSCLNLRDNSNRNREGSSTKCNCGELVKAPEEHHHDPTIFLDSPKRRPISTPEPKRFGSADVVSVSIAQRLANIAKNKVSEKQLQYGSLKEPRIPEKKVKKNNGIVINEESFFDTKGQVLEINPNIFHREQNQSPEVSDDIEEDNSKKSNEPFQLNHLKFEDIGYDAHEQNQNSRYNVVKNTVTIDHDCGTRRSSGRRHNHRNGQSCNCHRDLVVDQSAISEQSISYESNLAEMAEHLRNLST